MRGQGENNSKACLKNHEALHIKMIRKIQMPNDKIGDVIKYIQIFYPLPYHTIYMIINKRYTHLDKLIETKKI